MGSLVAGCDGGSSLVRKVLFPEMAENYRLPVQLLGLKVLYTAEQVAELRKLDHFFLQGCASQNDSFAYFSGEFCAWTLFYIPPPSSRTEDGLVHEAIYSLASVPPWGLWEGANKAEHLWC